MMADHRHIFFFVDLLVLCALAGFYGWTSRLNQFFFFGRTAPAGFAASAAARAIEARYRRLTLTGLLSAMTVFGFFLWNWNTAHYRFPMVAALAIAVVYQAAWFHGNFARAHRAAGKALAAFVPEPGGPAEASRVIAVPLLGDKAGAPPRALTVVLPAAVAACLWAVAMGLSHLSASGLAAAIEARHADFLMGFGLGLMGSTVGGLLLLRFSSRQRTPLGRFTNSVGLAGAWAGATVLSAAALSVPAHTTFSHTATRAVLAVFVVLAAARILYGLVYTRRFAPAASERFGDEHWKWGLYYYNRTDPALFIQHRVTPGYTLNFANVFSWPIAVAIYANLAALVYLQLR